MSAALSDETATTVPVFPKSEFPLPTESDQPQEPQQQPQPPHTKGQRRLEYVEDDLKRRQAFSKRKKGLFSKLTQVHKKTGKEGFMILLSETGRVYFQATTGMEDLLKIPGVNQVLCQCLACQTPSRPLRRTPTPVGVGPDDR